MFNRCILVLFLAFALVVNGQTTTTTDAAGRTIIQVITTNTDGRTTTRTISTMTSTGTSTGTSTSTTRTRTTSDAQGPVAAPAPTTGTPGAPTPYTYTTVVNGVTTVLSDIFTPTSPATVSFSPSAVGTEWAYSSWLSIYGPPKTAKSSATRSIVPSSPFLIGVAVFVFHWPRLLRN